MLCHVQFTYLSSHRLLPSLGRTSVPRPPAASVLPTVMPDQSNVPSFAAAGRAAGRIPSVPAGYGSSSPSVDGGGRLDQCLQSRYPTPGWPNDNLADLMAAFSWRYAPDCIDAACDPLAPVVTYEQCCGTDDE